MFLADKNFCSVGENSINGVFFPEIIGLKLISVSGLFVVFVMIESFLILLYEAGRCKVKKL